MAVYRSLYTTFWQDPFIIERSTDEKFFYIYLMTNPKTSICGIYELSLSVAALETGFTKAKVETLIDKFQREYHKIIYSKQTSEVCIVNWLRYNGNTSPKVQAAIKSAFDKVKDKRLITCITSDSSAIMNEDTVSVFGDRVSPSDCSMFNDKDSSFVPLLQEEDNKTVYERICEEWNEKMIGKNISQIKFPFTKVRKSHIDERLKEHGENVFMQMISRISRSDFANGRNKNKWIVSFSWCIESPENFVKIIEGNYDNRNTIETEETFEEMIARRVAAAGGEIK